MKLFSANIQNKTSTMLEVGWSRGVRVCVFRLGAKHNQPAWPGLAGLGCQPLAPGGFAGLA